ncbi:MAG: haloacid dehalogenase [Pseudomonadota bacterium]
MYKKDISLHSEREVNSIDPTSVAFDIDGVVADTMSLFIDIAKRDFSIDTIRYEDITSYSLEECLDIEHEIITAIVQKLLDGDYSEPLRPIQDAPVVLSGLAKQFGPLLFVTARPYPGPIVEWLMENLSLDSSGFEIITTGAFDAKADILLNRGITHFVEDRLETCHILDQKGIMPILFRQPWNRNNNHFLEVGSWRELEKLIRFK